MGATGRGETILLVDDDALSREVLAAVLAGEEYAVVAVSSGEEAVSSLAGRAAPAGAPAASGVEITAVLTDLQMPGLAGMDLAGALRSVDGRPVTLLLMSASRPLPEVAAAFDGFLRKPFAVEQVAEVLRRARTELSRVRPDGLAGFGEEVERAPVLDEATFAQVAAAMPWERLTELFRMCFGEADRQMGRMETFAAAGDSASFRRSAHMLKGSFGMVGARELAALAAEMEAEGLDSKGAEQAGTEPRGPEAVDSTTKVASLANFRAALYRLRGMLRSREIDV